VTRGRAIALGSAAVLLVAAFGAAFVVLPRWFAEPPAASVPAEQAAPPTTPKIKARLFYVSEDGQHLIAWERDVAVGDTTLAQARRIVEAELERPSPPLASAIPEGTTLRAIHLGGAGEAYVDLSREVADHPGGTFEEILTVYSIVNAVTENLPAIRSVQILVDGHEVDTLAGHVDLRRPLRKDTAWVLGPPPREPGRQN